MNRYLIHVKPPYNNFTAYITTIGDAKIVDVEII